MKLRQFRHPPLTVGLSPAQVFSYLARFALRGVLSGGPRRWYHLARSLVPALRDPRLVPFAILNWTYGLAIQAFVRDHLKDTATPPIAHTQAACSILDCPTA
jgi:hypothetical protein